MAYLFILIAIATLLSTIKEWSKLTTILILVFAILIGFAHLNSLEKPTYGFMIIPILYLFLNFAISNFKKIESLKWKFVFPLFLSILFLIPTGIQINFNEYVLELSSLSNLFVIGFGTMIIPIARLKVKIVAKPFDILDNDQFEHAVVLLLVGIGIFISSFFASYVGVYLFAFGFLASTFFYRNSYQNTVGFILLFSTLSLFLGLIEIDVLDLSLGKSAEGLLFGAALYLLTKSMFSARRYKPFAIGFTFVLIVLVMSGLLLIGTQKTDFGGVDSFLIALFALSLCFALEMKGQLGIVVVSLLIGLGLSLAPLTVNSEENESTKTTLVPLTEIKESNIEEKKSLFESKGISLESVVGNYTINPKTAQLNFELGPKGGRTKGAFNEVAGDIQIKTNLSSSTFSVDLPVNELTTFNKYRDESLMDVGYFNVKKFDKMTFKTSKLAAVNDGYEIQGEFSMLGIFKTITVQVKYIGKSINGNPILVGKSSLDRTEFGMKPDPKEGNVVDFEFSVELIQK
jgi:polyisoprenoid-binding protein YceI